jgi:hypothetical protein
MKPFNRPSSKSNKLGHNFINNTFAKLSSSIVKTSTTQLLNLQNEISAIVQPHNINNLPTKLDTTQSMEKPSACSSKLANFN